MIGCAATGCGGAGRSIYIIMGGGAIETPGVGMGAIPTDTAAIGANTTGRGAMPAMVWSAVCGGGPWAVTCERGCAGSITCSGAGIDTAPIGCASIGCAGIGA